MNEEPKQIKCYCGHTIMCDCSPIEEAKQGLNLPLLEQKLDEALSNETEESLNTWLKEKRDKQETLEEVAVNCWAEGDWDNRDSFTDGFIEGAKWQQEQILQFLYSEITERRPYSSSKMCEVIIEFIEQLNTKK